MRIAKKQGTDVYYFHKDHLGSSIAITNASGNELETTEYLPYGSNRTHWAQTADISDYKFTDQELDTSTNLYNYDARLYDPVTGRFISPDSMIPDVYNPQSLNRYSYCLNNPLIYTDPSGHFVLVELGVVVLLAGFGLLSGMAMLQNDTLKLPDFGFGYDPYDPVNVKPWSPADNNDGDNTGDDTNNQVDDDAGTAEDSADPSDQGDGSDDNRGNSDNGDNKDPQNKAKTGKTDKHVNQDKVKAAKDKLNELIKKRDTLSSKRMKTKADNIELKKLQNQIKHQRFKATGGREGIHWNK